MNDSVTSDQPSAFELAALANAMIPELHVLGVKDHVTTDRGSVATVVDGEGKDWQVWSPSSTQSDGEVQRLLSLFRLLEGYVQVGQLSFGVPVPSGVIQRKPGQYVLVFPHLGGEPGSVRYLSGTSPLATSIGKAIGRLHNLPTDAYYESTETLNTLRESRERLLKLVSEHSAVIPSDLRTRWNGALKDPALWQATPVPVHGSLDADDLQVAPGGALLGIRGFEQARVDDAAYDLVWLMYYADDPFLLAFESAYARERSAKDLHLLTRAQLYAELETLKWYDQAAKADDADWRKAGAEALRALAEDLQGELLVPAKAEVAEIHFTADQEPLLRLNRNLTPDAPTQATVASERLEES